MIDNILASAEREIIIEAQMHAILLSFLYAIEVYQSLIYLVLALYHDACVVHIVALPVT